MDRPFPFMSFFPEIYPRRRPVNVETETELVGMIVKSVMFHQSSLLCRALVVYGCPELANRTVTFKVVDIAAVVGYDLELDCCEGTQGNWKRVRRTWAQYMTAEPERVRVTHDDIKRHVDALVFPLKSISLGKRYMDTVAGALTFWDFSPENGYYLTKDGNVPALCSGVMFGRLYFLPARKVLDARDRLTLAPSDLIYDHELSEAEAQAFNCKHRSRFLRAACLDIETVFDNDYRDRSLRCESFGSHFPHCTEKKLAEMTKYKDRLTLELEDRRAKQPGSSRISISSLNADLSGQQHEITCVSLVILNSHKDKTSAPGGHRKELMVLYNGEKVRGGALPELDKQLMASVGISKVRRIKFFPCSGEFSLLSKLVRSLAVREIELLYVYNAEFDLRVINQRMNYYAAGCCSGRGHKGVPRSQGLNLLRAWNNLFVSKAFGGEAEPSFQFETIRFLEMHQEMMLAVGKLIHSKRGEALDDDYRLEVAKFNKNKSKLGHFKMNSCGMNVIDLLRVAATRSTKFACTSMKLNDVAPHLINSARKVRGQPEKDSRKLFKVAEVSYEKMDGMIHEGGKGLFAVLVYNLVDSQLCAQLAKVLQPVSALFSRCRTALNIDVIVHGRGDTFGGFVQSIHAVRIPQLKYKLDNLRATAGPRGREHPERTPWAPERRDSNAEEWQGGAVCAPLTGLHYSGPGMGLELSFDFSGMYPAIMCALNISPETTIPWPPKDFAYDLSGWVCYSWEREGFPYASLIMKHDPEKRGFIRDRAVMSSSAEYYLNRRADYKNKLKSPDLSNEQRSYYKTQEGECKVLANSFYGTAAYPCGQLIAGHGRRQIAVVNRCVSTFYEAKCPVVYGDTDSVMVSVGYGPGDAPEPEVGDRCEDPPEHGEEERLRAFASKAREAIARKFEIQGAPVPRFLDAVHKTLVEDTLEGMYAIGPGNEHERAFREPGGARTSQGYPVYLARAPGSREAADITAPFVENIRVKLEYENSSSVYCHVAKKTYVTLTHTIDENRELANVSVKVKGLAAFKSMRSACDSAVTEMFIACVMRGDCLKLEEDRARCFSTEPWHELRAGDSVLYPKRAPTFDRDTGLWAEVSEAEGFLACYRVDRVTLLKLDSGFSAVAVRLLPARASRPVEVRTLYKDGKYCLNHMFSSAEAIRRDLIACRASGLVASRMAAGFFPWRSLIRSAKNKRFKPPTLERFKVGSASVKTTYVETVKTWVQKITGLTAKPSMPVEFFKCKPCEAAFYRYPLHLQAKGCLVSMFGGSLLCKRLREPAEDEGGEERPETWNLVNHPNQPGSTCYAGSRALVAHEADRTLINARGKLVAHCIVDYCLVGMIVKSVMFHQSSLLCRALVVYGCPELANRTVTFKVVDIAAVVGYDLELDCCEGTQGNWKQVRRTWAQYMTAEPERVRVTHDDIKRHVDALVFPLKSISLGKRYMDTVAGALTFGDFSPENGYYLTKDGNVPALCSGVMFGRLYFLPARKVLDARDRLTLAPSDLIYDHELSEAEAQAFNCKHRSRFLRAACLDIETVFDNDYRDRSLRCESFGSHFPHCTEKKLAEMTKYKDRLTLELEDRRAKQPGSSRISIPSLNADLSGQQHEITCVSLVILNSHKDKTSAPGGHRKELMVLYNGEKVRGGALPELDKQLMASVGISKVRRIKFFPCSGEFSLLSKLVRSLAVREIELLYVYNAEFDLRVINQRMNYYAAGCCSGRGHKGVPRSQGLNLLRAWNNLFVSKAFGGEAEPSFQFETIRFLEMHQEMMLAVGKLIHSKRGEALDDDYRLEVAKFNKNKSKLGHFKMNSCGMNVIDLLRVAATRSTKFACSSMKLNDVAPHLINSARKVRGQPEKDSRKLFKVAEVSYEKMDGMIHEGGKGLFAVLVYNLVDSQLCARLAKVLQPVSALFSRCRTALNIDVIVHGRGDTFGGFVQSIHAVRIPQLKYKLDNLRATAGPRGREHPERTPWAPERRDSNAEEWQGGAVCAPLMGLHYSGPGMGLELSFDFSGMYPAIMCALNISPETTIPWPPKDFAYDLSGWVCYSWEREGFPYASLIMKHDPEKRAFIRDRAVMSSSAEYYLNRRADYKNKLKSPDLSNEQRSYYKTQEGECKVLANSFYGTAAYPCGQLIAGHGRRQIAVVNRCVSTFYEAKCPVVYGDTDSVMVSVGYGPGDAPEPEVGDRCEDPPEHGEEERLRAFASKAREAIARKFEIQGAPVPRFLDAVHKTLVEDTLEGMYAIGPGNEHERAFREPGGARTSQGYPVYLARAPGSREAADITAPFVENIRVKLEYENSSSVYCHVAKKTYVTLTHTIDENRELANVSVKVRGLAAFKSMRSACDSAVTEMFIACVMRGDCLKLEEDRARCFSTEPWHELRAGDSVLYPKRAPTFDRDTGLWAEVSEAEGFLACYRVDRVTLLKLDSGFSAVAVRLLPARASRPVAVRTLYKDGKYCLNHMFSSAEAIRRDLIACRASGLVASRMAAGFFPWRSLIRSAKNKRFKPPTLERFKVGSASVKTTYVETVKTWVQKITGLTAKPSMPVEFFKCKPCEAAFYRYPLHLQAKGCLVSVFGGSLLCKRLREPAEDEGGEERPEPWNLVNHPNQPGSTCYAGSRALVAHEADRTLINARGKLVAHCIVDYCLPRHMYSSARGSESLKTCRAHLLNHLSSVTERLARAETAFLSVINNCPRHMIPACGSEELALVKARRETVWRLSGEKRKLSADVIKKDMGLDPEAVYKVAALLLGEKLTKAVSEGTVALTRERPADADAISVAVPESMLRDAGFSGSENRISVLNGELSENSLLDLAGVLYQAVLLQQICKPDVFPQTQANIPSSVLCIMPYSCEDVESTASWIEAFERKGWVKEKGEDEAANAELPQSSRKRNRCSRDVVFHCHGCRKFFDKLFKNNVQKSDLMDFVYCRDSKRRRFGTCVTEKKYSW